MINMFIICPLLKLIVPCKYVVSSLYKNTKKAAFS